MSSSSNPSNRTPAYLRSSSQDATLEAVSDNASPSSREGVPVRIQHSVDDEAAPGLDYTIYRQSGSALITDATVTDDGRILVNLVSKTKLPDLPRDYGLDLPEFATTPRPPTSIPPLHIVIQIVGSRGDVQPFLALATALKAEGHRVRLATHAVFKGFVEENGVEFFDVGGDPKELMAYMVKNPGLIPGFESLHNGDIPRKRQMISTILQGCFRSTYEQSSSSGEEPFVADAIVMNPPSFAGVHVGEALGVPVHVMFTMPWCSTTAFPHPLVNIGRAEGVQPSLLNYLTYGLADHLSWQGLGDVINEFRSKTLGLEALTLRSGPNLLERLRIPWTYCWSPSLIPKPPDWRSHIDVCGFWFHEGETGYRPDPALEAFLDAGEAPIYIGFGSVPVSDPARMTNTIFDAVRASGRRALVSAGWGGLGGASVPDNIFVLGNVPHDWLFQKVSVVVHHGGAGTTAIGLKLGKPTVVVPFFGDQAFWGQMVQESGAGPKPIPPSELTTDVLKRAIEEALRPEARAAAERLGSLIRAEDGVRAGVDSFHRHLPLLNMRCEIEPDQAAAWFCEKYCIELSAGVAHVLVDAKQLSYRQLVPHRSKEYLSRADITDPVTGGGSAILRTVSDYYVGIAKSFVNPVKGVPLAIIAIPRGVASIVGRTSEGFRNLPKLYGGQVRHVEPPKNFGDGVKKGFQGLGYGYLDAVTGLVDEPMRGAQSEGGLGFFKGAARGILNASFKPAAGALGIVEHPARGILNSFKKRGTDEVISRIAELRRKQGALGVPASASRRSKILDKWKAETSKERVEERVKVRTQRQKELGESIGIRFVESDEEVSAAGEVVASTSTTETACPAGTSPAERSTTDAVVTPSTSTPARPDDSDAQFERDLELAKMLSLAEQRGYQRGRAEAYAGR